MILTEGRYLKLRLKDAAIIDTLQDKAIGRPPAHYVMTSYRYVELPGTGGSGNALDNITDFYTMVSNMGSNTENIMVYGVFDIRSPEWLFVTGAKSEHATWLLNDDYPID